MSAPTVPVLLGVDVGTTEPKCWPPPPTASNRCRGRPHPWRNRTDGGAETDPNTMAADVFGLLARGADAAAEAAVDGPVQIVIGVIAGMAEAGALVDRTADRRTPSSPGSTHAVQTRSRSTPQHFRDEFPAAPDLPVSPLATFAKLLWLRPRAPTSPAAG